MSYVFPGRSVRRDWWASCGLCGCEMTSKEIYTSGICLACRTAATKETTPVETKTYTITPAMDILLEFICKTEAGGNWNAYWGHSKSLSPNLAAMTLQTLRHWMTNRGTPPSSATGGLQFMSYTLFGGHGQEGIVQEMGLSMGTLFTSDLQRQLGAHLLMRRGYAAWQEGRMSDADFGNQLAFEWASFPRWTSFANPKGRTIRVGQSAYAGDGLNKALVPVDTIKAIFAKMRAAHQPPEAMADSGVTVRPEVPHDEALALPQTKAVAGTGQSEDHSRRTKTLIEEAKAAISSLERHVFPWHFSKDA